MRFPRYDKLWAIPDIDGTISDCSARVPLAEAARAEPDKVRRSELWDEFHAKCTEDPPHLAEVMILRAWNAAGGKLAYITGRTDKYRRETETWLKAQGLPISPLIMRGPENYTNSLDYKKRSLIVIRETIPAGDEIAFIMEDQDKLVDQWRKLGYTCLQPRASAFGDYR